MASRVRFGALPAARCGLGARRWVCRFLRLVYARGLFMTFRALTRLCTFCAVWVFLVFCFSRRLSGAKPLFFGNYRLAYAKPILSGLRVVRVGLPGGFPATPGPAGRSLGDLVAAAGGLLVAVGGSAAALGGLLVIPESFRCLWAAPWRLPPAPWRLPAPTGPPPDDTRVTRRLTRTVGAPPSVVVSLLVCCLEYLVSFVTEFHGVEFLYDIGRVTGYGKNGS